jgi:putative ABC transport system permease protein
MRRVVVRGFFARRLRAILTGIAIALGVALMAGTYILTDTIDHSFANIFNTAAKGRSVVVVPHQGLGANAAVQTATVGEAVLARVQKVPGVAQAAGEVFTSAALFADGKHLNKRSANFVGSTLPPRFENFAAVSGHLPTNPGEVAIDQGTAQRYSLKVGEKLRVAGASTAVTYRIGGIIKFAGSASFGGAGIAVLTLGQARRVADEPSSFDEVIVAAAPSVSDKELRARIRSVLPSTLDVRTGLQEAAQQTSDLQDQLGFLRTFLLIFAYVALFVGAFIIFNTFSITVAQRTREFGLLRMLGATRGQILRSVVVEGVMLGLLGSGLGLLAGFGLAPALEALFKVLFGADLPDNGTVLEARTVWVSLLAGTVVTVLAGLLPAIRASRVTPIAALREGVSLHEKAPRSQRRRRIIIVIVAALVVIRLIALASSGAGVVTILILAIIIISLRLPQVRRRIGRGFSRIIVVLAHTLGGLLAWRGITGRLARDNTIRHPGRTAVTAAALMIGLALVSLISVLAAGTKASIDNAIDASFAGQLILSNTSQTGNQGIPTEIPAAVRAIGGVQQVTAVAFTEGKIHGVKGLKGNQSITALEPVSFARVYKIDWDQGSNAVLEHLDTTGTVLTQSFADAHHFHVGTTLSVQTPSGRRITLVVRGIATDNAGLLADLTITLPLARSAFSQRTDAIDFVSYKPGVTDAQVQPKVNRLLSARFPQTQSQTAAQFKASLASQVNSLLALIYVLLALSVIVSLFGIVNTLVLSIYERTRELGMLRAIGTTRRQVRQMIRYESVITALVGGVLGIVLGIAIAGILAATALSGSGFVFVIPVVTMVVLFVLAGIAGLLAAAWPARRAAAVDILAALATE